MQTMHGSTNTEQQQAVELYEEHNLNITIAQQTETEPTLVITILA